ncbi:hypothetical protein SCD_n01307 [Sulfuricella denitrificans skB26]|uniref:SbsA Ig-like domain-containing protein n=1 Tax=Sulfuricella denitrificans (strain DSM 22764 / NBRC 105220 / skB26) TaxID=1163617 RepID=S6AKK7_SULDS|nr:Ig-like domain-containing protein [Sulfuricella denitrificans]BAN35134.1 hypothetical protein SCD_n01307 [Sulfuricella denitrificans skB26]
MKKIFTSLCAVVLLGSGMAQAMGPDIVNGSATNNFTMLSPANSTIGGSTDVTFTWDGTYRTTVVTDGTWNATLASPTPFFGFAWTAHHVNIYAPGTYVFNAGCAAGNASCGTGPNLALTVPAGKVGVHMLFDWNTSSNIDVVLLWDMNKSWAQNGTSSPFFTGTGSATTATVWNGVSLDVDADGFAGAKMVDGPFGLSPATAYSANFNVNGIAAATTPVAAPADLVPSNLATAVAPNAATSIAVTFSEAMDVASVQSAFTVDAGVNICTGIVASNSDKTFTCTHNALALSTIHIATISTGAKSAKGIPLASAVTWSFTTHFANDVVAPIISGALTPVNGAVNTLNTQPIAITFSEPMAGSTATAMTVAANGVAVTGVFQASNSNQTFTFVPTAGVLPNSSTIVVTVPAAGAVADGAGNPLAASPAWSFTTEVPASLVASGATLSVTGGNMVSTEPLSAASAQSTAAGFGKSPPSGVTFNNGFVKYKVNGVASGGAATIRIVFPRTITGKAFYKFKQSTGDYILLTVGGGPNQYLEVNATTIDLNVVDGGSLDDDGAANTIIVDPVGDADVVVGATASTLGVSGGGGGCAVDPSGKDASLLVALLASLGYVGWRRRRS